MLKLTSVEEGPIFARFVKNSNGSKVIGIKVIGLTGGIACGKSTVAAILHNMGIITIDADQIAHQEMEMETGTQVYTEIVREFGSQILTVEGRINRRELGKIVFTNPNAKIKLENITHPVIIDIIKTLIRRYTMENIRLVVVEIPLLVESAANLFDVIWVVSADPKLQLERLIKYRNLSRTEAESRLANQFMIPDKEGKTAIIIYNNKGFDDLKLEVIRLVKMLNQDLGLPDKGPL